MPSVEVDARVPNSFSPRYKAPQARRGLEFIKLDEPSQSELSVGWFAPYEIRMSNSEVRITI
jgi:hypothetical protein